MNGIECFIGFVVWVVVVVLGTLFFGITKRPGGDV